MLPESEREISVTFAFRHVLQAILFIKDYIEYRYREFLEKHEMYIWFELNFKSRNVAKLESFRSHIVPWSTF